MKQVSSATGTASFWQEYYLPNFSGVGKYLDCDGFLVVVTKAGSNPMPADFHKVPIGQAGPHLSAAKYGYGAMFHGKFFKVEDEKEVEGLTQADVPGGPKKRNVVLREI